MKMYRPGRYSSANTWVIVICHQGSFPTIILTFTLDSVSQKLAHVPRYVLFLSPSRNNDRYLYKYIVSATVQVLREASNQNMYVHTKASPIYSNSMQTKRPHTMHASLNASDPLPVQ